MKEDGDARTVEGFASVFNNVDSYNDIVMPGAFAKSIKSRKPAMLWQHNSSEPIGVWDELEEQKRGLYVKGRILSTSAGNDAYTLVKAGAVTGMSIGYSALKWETYLYGVEDGQTYQIRLRFATGILRSDWTEPHFQLVIGKSEPPSDVALFVIENTKLSWSLVSDLDLAGYVIRYQNGMSRSWGDALPLHTGYLTQSPFDPGQLPPGQLTIMIKALDTTGNESVNPTYIITSIPEPQTANIVATFNRKTSGWPGTLSGGTINGSNNLEASVATFMWGDYPLTSMWSVVSTDLMWAVTTYDLMQYHDSITVSTALTGSRMTIQADVTGDPWSILYRDNSSSSLMWDVDGTTLMWGTSGSIFWTLPDWQPWPGQVPVRNSIYDFLITTGYSATQGLVSEFIVTEAAFKTQLTALFAALRERGDSARPARSKFELLDVLREHAE